MKNKSKVAFITNTSWFLHNFYYYFIKKIATDHELHILTPDSQYLQEFKELGVKFHYFKMNRRGMKPIEDVGTIISLHRIIKEQKFNWVLNFTIKPNIYGSIAAKLAGSKSFINITGRGTSLISTGLTSKIVSLLFKVACLCASKTMFSNRDDKDFYVGHGLCHPKKAILVSGSGIDVDHFHPSAKDKSIDFLFIGRMITDKGLRELFEASSNLIKEYPNLNVSLAGPIDSGNPTGISEDELLSSESTRYIGEFKDIREALKKAKCVVLPSYSEGFPRVLQEAGLMEICQITTNVAGCRDLVKDEYNGFICEARDPLDLELAMRKFINLDESKRIEMQKNARKYIYNNFSEKIVEKQMLDFLYQQ